MRYELNCQYWPEKLGLTRIPISFKLTSFFMFLTGLFPDQKCVQEKTLKDFTIAERLQKRLRNTVNDQF